MAQNQITSPSKNNGSAIDQGDENNPIFNLTLSCNASSSFSSPSSSYRYQEDVTSNPINKAKLLKENQPPKPSTQVTSEIDQEDENNPIFNLTLSGNASSSFSSSSSSSISHVSKKKKNLYQEDVITSNPIKKAKFSEKNGLRGREERWLRLTMAPPDIFSIKKTLEESDVNNLTRLMLSKAAVEEDLLAYFDEDMKRRLKDKDYDIEYNMKMKMWGSNGSVVLNDRWITKFVKRRGLKRGDKIELYCDSLNSRLVFSLLRKASIDATPISFRIPN